MAKQLDTVTMARMAGRLTAALPPRLSAVARAALEHNPYLHGRIPQPGARARARRALGRAAARGDTQAKTAMGVAKIIARAQHGDTGPAIALTRKVIQQSKSPVMGGRAELRPVPVLAGRIGRKFRNGLRKYNPLALAHKVTHTGPIRKAELKLQGAVGKVLPFTKPFIAMHNKISDKIYTGLHKAKLIGKTTRAPGSKKISLSEVASVAAAAKGHVKLNAKANATISTALSTAKKYAAHLPNHPATKALAAASKGLDAAAAELKRLRSLQGTFLVSMPNPTTFVVRMPNGQNVTVPTSKVRGAKPWARGASIKVDSKAVIGG